mmetsp:Transcript_6051/g.10412  ORF Transcript_6051/g.10412 Transcript_6051/m.10412 type:complete len:126 (+) Transcript_6051:61-438(+)
MAQTDFAAVGSAFVNHYYRLFDADRNQLLPLYQPNSMLTFEGEQFMGTQAIGQKLTTLPFTKVQHQINTCDSQPTPGNGVLVFVSGQLLVEGSEHAIRFSQIFHLMPLPSGGYYCLNDMFRLNYG